MRSAGRAGRRSALALLCVLACAAVLAAGKKQPGIAKKQPAAAKKPAAARKKALPIEKLPPVASNNPPPIDNLHPAAAGSKGGGAEHNAYSWYQCIQRCTLYHDECTFEANWRVTSCYFRNVCVNTTSKNIVYYLDPKATASVHTEEFFNNKSGFPSPLAFMQAGNVIPQEDPSVVVSVELRRNQAFPTKAFFLPGPVVYMEPFTPNNFGHCITDNVFPAYRLLRRFGMADQVATMLFRNLDYEAEVGFQSLTGVNLQNLFIPMLTRSSILTVGIGKLHPDKNDLVCTHDLLVGMGKLGLYTDSEVWEQFNVRMMKVVGVSPYKVPQKHRIVVFKKEGRRAVTNVDKLAIYLERTFNVNVQVVEVAKLQLKRQAQIVNTATVVISPCGGLSFSSVYLPRHSAAIFICTWDPEWKVQHQVDRVWYDRQTRFHVFYYPVDDSEITINTTYVNKNGGDDHKLTPQNLYRNFADVEVSLQKMAKVVHSALHQVELSLGWDLSYTPPVINEKEEQNEREEEVEEEEEEEEEEVNDIEE